MNKKTKYLTVALAIAVLLPSVALAAWWNPFSWGVWKKAFRQEQKQEKIIGGNSEFAKLDKDELLGKMFPNLTFRNGKADLSKEKFFNGNANISLYLKKSVEDYFISSSEKNLLLMAQLDGVPHVAGLFHEYLGIFDSKGNLLTPAAKFPRVNEEFNLYEDKNHFGGDAGEFGFYDCKGIKQILFVSSGCPNSTCCSDIGHVYKVSNGAFQEVQTLNYQNNSRDSGFAIKMIVAGNKIQLKKLPWSSENNCPVSPYKSLSWNADTCSFAESRDQNGSGLEGKCKKNTDCPTIYCIKAPCPINICVDGKCKLTETVNK